MRALALVALFATTASAQSITALNSASFMNIYGTNTTFFHSQMFKTAEVNKLLSMKVKSKVAPKPAAEPAPAWRYELSATDFTPAGARVVPQQLAKTVAEKERASVVEACQAIVPAIEQTPGFRKNNLAAALTLLLGVSFQVAGDVELTDEETVALTRALNEAMAADPKFASLTAEQRTQAYDTFVITGGLIAGAAEAANESKDKATLAAAKELASASLKQFGIAAPKAKR